MCGIVGIWSPKGGNSEVDSTIARMTETLHHRGPDETKFHIEPRLAVGFKRLSIQDIKNGSQPFMTPDGSVLVFCNGEIFNHVELRRLLLGKGHKLKTNCDVEVLPYLYWEYGPEMLNMLNGQFALVVYDKRNEKLILARDQFGICPLFYTKVKDVVFFASEIKALLEHPMVSRKISLVGLDHFISLPGLNGSETLFDGIQAISPGHYLNIGVTTLHDEEYWDICYPQVDIANDSLKVENEICEGIEHFLMKSVSRRMISDVPIGFYLSGGLDSSIIGAFMRKIQQKETISSFSMRFPHSEDVEIDESKYQHIVQKHLATNHLALDFGWSEITDRIERVVFHSESPLKELYNVCSYELSSEVSKRGYKVILCGEGADELFGGYAGYKFDVLGRSDSDLTSLEQLLEDETRVKLWGAPLNYDGNIEDIANTKRRMYSNEVLETFDKFNFTKTLVVKKDKIANRSPFHQRSYLDFKIRLAGHLIADHGDRMTYANSVEGRYPFLDIELMKFVSKIPPNLQLHNLVEKYLLKKIGVKYIPSSIVNREKFGFVAPGSIDLLKHCHEWAQDMLSYDRNRRLGYFNPNEIERLKKIYLSDGFKILPNYQIDWLMVVLTFNVFLDLFKLPTLNAKMNY